MNPIAQQLSSSGCPISFILIHYVPSSPEYEAQHLFSASVTCAQERRPSLNVVFPFVDSLQRVDGTCIT